MKNRPWLVSTVISAALLFSAPIYAHLSCRLGFQQLLAHVGLGGSGRTYDILLNPPGGPARSKEAERKLVLEAYAYLTGEVALEPKLDFKFYRSKDGSIRINVSGQTPKGAKTFSEALKSGRFLEAKNPRIQLIPFSELAFTQSQVQKSILDGYTNDPKKRRIAFEAPSPVFKMSEKDGSIRYYVHDGTHRAMRFWEPDKNAGWEPLVPVEVMTVKDYQDRGDFPPGMTTRIYEGILRSSNRQNVPDTGVPEIVEKFTNPH